MAVVTAIAFATTLHQKRIADKRFDEVRSLARSVVFELHDAIAPLPGSTAARELLVRRALVYLDTLAAEAADNTPLQIELSGAYMKIGDVQGLPYRSNLGHTAGAMTSYRKALAIAQTVRESEPENADALTLLADAHDRIGFVEERSLRWDVALAAHETARAIRESLPPGPRRDLALARTWTGIGDCRYIGHKGKAQEAYQSAISVLARVPNTPQLRGETLIELARAHQRLGGFFTGVIVHDLRRAIDHHDAALRALEERTALDPEDAMARRNYADQFVMKATAQTMMKDGQGALQSTTRGLELLTELASADPKNAEARHDLAFAYGERGRALLLLGRFDDAERAFEQAIAIQQRLVDEDPSNHEDARDLKRTKTFLAAARRGGS